MSYQTFIDLYTLLDGPSRNKDKADALIRYIELASPSDTAWARKLFKQEKPQRSITPQTLRIWAHEESAIPIWLIEESYKAGGDLSETLALLFPDNPSERALTLSQWIDECILPLQSMPPDLKRHAVVAEWRNASVLERVLFNKLITGTYRSPVSKVVMQMAFGKVTSYDEPVHPIIDKPKAKMIAVLLYVQIARGTQSAEYTFGIWNKSELIPIVKISSALPEAAKRAIDRHVRLTTTERFGPVRTVAPTMVFEIGYESVAESSRHKSGLSMKNPVILGLRSDKSPEDIAQLEDIKLQPEL